MRECGPGGEGAEESKTPGAVNVECSHRIDCFCGKISLTESLRSFMQINCVRLHRLDFSTSLASRFCSGMGFCKISFSFENLIVSDILFFVSAIEYS